MRLFTGLDLPERDRQTLAQLVGQLRPLAPALRWLPAENLHVTTKFIGEWPEARLDELKAALAAAPTPPAPLEFHLDGLGWFPNPHQPRIFWAAIKAPPELARLAAGTEAALEPLGVAREERPYRPHLTLARIGGPGAGLAPLRRAVALLPSVDFGRAHAHAWHLYLSESGRYTKLATYPLGAGEAPPKL